MPFFQLLFQSPNVWYTSIVSSWFFEWIAWKKLFRNKVKKKKSLKGTALDTFIWCVGSSTSRRLALALCCSFNQVGNYLVILMKLKIQHWSLAVALTTHFTLYFSIFGTFFIFSAQLCWHDSFIIIYLCCTFCLVVMSGVNFFGQLLP